MSTFGSKRRYQSSQVCLFVAGIDHCHLQQLLQSLNLGGRRHRRRWLWMRRLGEGRRWLGQRNKFSVQVTVKHFFNLIEGSREWVPWKRSERLWSTFIWWCHIRWGILSLVQWNLVKRFVTWKRMFVVWDLRIATFPHAPQFLGYPRLAIELTQFWAWSGRAQLQQFL